MGSAVLLSRLGAHQCQAAAGVERLAVLQSLLLAVGFDLDGGGAGLGVNDQFLEDSHSQRSAISASATSGLGEDAPGKAAGSG